jgi:hypothetical protein
MMFSSVLRSAAIKGKAFAVSPSFSQIAVRSMAGNAQSQTSAVRIVAIGYIAIFMSMLFLVK